MNEPIRSLFCKLIFLTLSFMTVSCIDESGKPTCEEEDQYTVTLSVKDKNYDNILDIPELSPESTNLPFGTYIEGISYRLEEMTTKKIVAYQDYLIVDPNEMTHTLVFNGIAPGSYLLTTLGNLPVASRTRATTMLVTLHDNGSDNTDIYMGTDTLNFTDAPNASSDAMGRLKGELLVVCKNFPVEIDKIILRVDSVHLGISEDTREYAEATYVTQSFDTQEELLQMSLAPTAPNRKSTLTLLLFTSNSTLPFIIVPDTKFTIQRNMVTEILVDFNAENQKIEISIRINGAWEKINEMHIDLE